MQQYLAFYNTYNNSLIKESFMLQWEEFFLLVFHTAWVMKNLTVALFTYSTNNKANKTHYGFLYFVNLDTVTLHPPTASTGWVEVQMRKCVLQYHNAIHVAWMFTSDSGAQVQKSGAYVVQTKYLCTHQELRFFIIYGPYFYYCAYKFDDLAFSKRGNNEKEDKNTSFIVLMFTGKSFLARTKNKHCPLNLSWDSSTYNFIILVPLRIPGIALPHSENKKKKDENHFIFF